MDGQISKAFTMKSAEIRCPEKEQIPKTDSLSASTQYQSVWTT
jgi:hypothetical protein